MAFYALNVHSEVDRRWKRDKAAVFRLFLRTKGRFCRGDRPSSDRRTGNGGGRCFPPLLSSRESGVEKTEAARQKSWSIYFCRMRRRRERENPLSAEGRTEARPDIYIYRETFSPPIIPRSFIPFFSLILSPLLDKNNLSNANDNHGDAA